MILHSQQPPTICSDADFVTTPAVPQYLGRFIWIQKPQGHHSSKLWGPKSCKHPPETCEKNTPWQFPIIPITLRNSTWQREWSKYKENIKLNPATKVKPEPTETNPPTRTEPKGKSGNIPQPLWLGLIDWDVVDKVFLSPAEGGGSAVAYTPPPTHLCPIHTGKPRLKLKKLGNLLAAAALMHI